MVLRQWIVPEPDPRLNLSVSQIDYTKLNYEDCYWIYSSKMRVHSKDFAKLKGFIDYATNLFDQEDIKRQEQKRLEQERLEQIKQIIPPTPPSIGEPFKKFNTNKSFPWLGRKIPFLKKPATMSTISGPCVIH